MERLKKLIPGKHTVQQLCSALGLTPRQVAALLKPLHGPSFSGHFEDNKSSRYYQIHFDIEGNFIRPQARTEIEVTNDEK